MHANTSVAATGAGQAPREGGRRKVVLAAGLIAAVLTAALYLAFIATHPHNAWLNPVDLHVYIKGGKVADHIRPAYDPARAAPLYDWPVTQSAFTYPPFAALVFAVIAWLPFHLVIAAWTVVSVAALAVTTWLVLGALGVTSRPARAGATLLLGAAGFWTAPVLHNIYLGQVELLLMALIVWDMLQPDRRWWKGAGVGVAAGIKLTPLIFIPYLLVTRRYRQAAVAAGTFALTVAVGFALPADARRWWFGGLMFSSSRTGFVGRNANQSLPALVTRLAGSVAGASPAWLIVAVVAGLAGIAAGALLHRAGHPVLGLLTCAVTGVLVSPVSWDPHWVWIAPVIAALACYGAAGRGPRRWAWLAAAVVVAGLFAAWPGQLWGQPRAGDFFEGLIWWPPGTGAGQFLRRGDQPGYAEYHWHGWQLLVGNLDILTGTALLAAAAVAAVVLAVRARRRAADGAVSLAQS